MARRKWTIEDYGRVNHAAISILGDSGSELDAQLAKAGVERRIALVTPQFVAALAAVGGSDMVSTLSHVFARRFADTFGLILKEPPLPVRDLDLTLVWNSVRSSDPVLTWVRRVIAETAKATMDIGSAA